jgi:DNA-binding NarL/FixJ family response regulator
MEYERPMDVDVVRDPKHIRILIADDHPILRDGLRKLLVLEPEFEVVGEAADGREALEKVSQLRPDILMLDLRMPNLDGLNVLGVMKELSEKPRVIVFTASQDTKEYVQAMKLGCSGIVVKAVAPDQIVVAIRKVHGGEIWLDTATMAVVMRHFSSGRLPDGSMANNTGRDRNPLSTREREIVVLIAQGYKNKEMAEKMFISEQTVKNHLHNIFDKVGVCDRLELALYAVHKGLHLAPEAVPMTA